MNDWTLEHPWRDNPYLQGLMRPIQQEVTDVDCVVTGEIPRQISGLLIRNGPNQKFPPLSQNYHFFDGDGMVHGLWLHEGTARYRNRWVRTTSYNLQEKAGKSLWGGILDHPLRYPSPHGAPTMKPHGGVNVVWHAGRLLALDEMGLPWELDPTTLDTVGEFDFNGRWDRAMTPHPKFDTRTGEMMTFGYDVHTQPYLQYAVVADTGVLEHKVDIPLNKPVMIHDIGLTERYSLLLDCPVVFNLTRGIFTGTSWRFDKTQGTRIGVMPRRGDAASIRWFDIKPCFVFHVMCAWEEGDEIVLVAPRIENFDMGDLGGLNPTYGEGNEEALKVLSTVPLMFQWRLNTRNGLVTEERLVDDRPVDFPRIDDRRMGQQVRYGYGTHCDLRHQLKYDLQEKTIEVHDRGEGYFGHEMIFAPNPEGTAEDDGWLMGYRYDLARDTSDFVILDAQRITDAPVAVVRLPQRVPMGPHGVWVPREHIPWPTWGEAE